MASAARSVLPDVSAAPLQVHPPLVHGCGRSNRFVVGLLTFTGREVLPLGYTDALNFPRTKGLMIQSASGRRRV
ncbi:uncharacterized protein V6R79_005910 [Siganus canaliculatus]